MKRAAAFPLGLLLVAACLEPGPLQETTPPDQGVALVPATLFLQPGSALSLTPTAGLSAGGPLSWQSSASSVASVSASGVVTALTTGVAEVRASNSRGTGRTAVTVVPAVPPIRSWRIARQGLTDVTLLGLWCVNAQTSFAVGQLGTILRSDDGGATWNRMVTPDSTDFIGVWGSDPANVYAVGAGGTILHFDGTGWSRMTTPTDALLLDVWGLAPDDIYAVGFGAALHYDGTAWRMLSGAEGSELWAVWGADRTHIFAAGQNGVLLRLEGNRWSRLYSPTQLLLLGLWGTSPQNIYAVGIMGTVLHWDGALWSPVPVPVRSDLFAIWGRSGAEILAVGDGGVMLLFNGSAWTLLPQSATGENLRAVHAAPGGGFLAAGWNGTALARRSNGSWQLGASAPLLFSIANGPGNFQYAVGGSGAVLRGTGGGSGPWAALEVARTRTLYGATQDNGDLLVVGEAGTILRYNGAGWADESVGAQLILRSIWMDESGAGGQGFIVGERGIILRKAGPASRWIEAPGVATRFLRHVFGLSAGAVYAVGDSGTVVHWDGTSWRAMRTPTDSLLRGVWGSGPRDVFAVGAGGTILRYDGTQWYAMPSPTTKELRAIWGTGPTDVYAAGEGGVLLWFDGAHWTRMSSPTAKILLGFQRGQSGVPTVVGGQGLVLTGQR